MNRCLFCGADFSDEDWPSDFCDAQCEYDYQLEEARKDYPRPLIDNQEEITDGS